MTIQVTDYPPVEQRAQHLGCNVPSGLAILPENFDSATTRSEFLYRPEAATVRTLLRNNKIEFAELLPDGERPSYVTNKNFDWTAPALFITASLLSDNGYSINIALGVIANYLTDFFKGIGGRSNIKMTIVVEKTAGKVYKKLEYEGEIEGIHALSTAILAISDE